MAQCQFCGAEDKAIHPDSGQQYGEPVCTDCYDVSPDPTNDAAYGADPGSSGPISRSREFHTSHMLHRGLISEQEDEFYGSGEGPDPEDIMERRNDARGERTMEYWDRKF